MVEKRKRPRDGNTFDDLDVTGVVQRYIHGRKSLDEMKTTEGARIIDEVRIKLQPYLLNRYS